MNIEAIIEAVAPDHDGHVSNIELHTEVLEQKDGAGYICARTIRYDQITVTIDLMGRVPDAD